MIGERGRAREREGERGREREREGEKGRERKRKEERERERDSPAPSCYRPRCALHPRRRRRKEFSRRGVEFLEAAVLEKDLPVS